MMDKLDLIYDLVNKVIADGDAVLKRLEEKYKTNPPPPRPPRKNKLNV
jgi:hypothetical protein